MAYAYPRGGRRDTPDPRDIVENAARAAGLSVEQWLDRAMADGQNGDSYRGRHGSRSRRAGRDRDDGGILNNFGRRSVQSSSFTDEYSDDRVTRIIEDAVEAMQETLQASEMRTASALDAIGRRLEEGMPPASRSNRVQDMMANIERNFGSQTAASVSADPSSLVRQLEERISNAVSLIEKRANGQERLQGRTEPRDLRQGTRHLQRQIAALTARLDTLNQQGIAQPPQVSIEVVQRLHDEVARLARSSQPPFDQREILSALQAVDAKISKLDETSNTQAPFEQLIKEVASLRASLRDNRQPPAIDQTHFDRKFEALSDRLDAIADKVAMRRASEPGDSQGSRSIELALEELKRLIQASHAPADDTRVLNALRSVERRLESMEHVPDALTTRLGRFDSLEEKLDAIQRAPADISHRLDQIQSLVAGRGDAPAPPLPPGLETLLHSLATRLEAMQSAPVDDRALERLQKDIRALSQKLDLSAASKPIQPPSDIRGLEQSISDLLQRVDGLKADLGVTAEQAVRRAASDVLARAPDREGLAPTGDTVQMQRQLSEIHVAQQEAERRTSETLGAVHETLKWVVDRLVDMEREMKQQADIGLQQPKPVAAQLLPDEPAAGGTARQPLPMAAEAAVVSTRPIVTNPLPPLGAPLQQPSSQTAVQMPGAVVAPAAAQESMSPDASAIGRIAAMRAQRIGVSVPTPQAAPASKSAIASAFAAAREAVAKRKSDKDKAGQPAAETGDESLFKPEGARQTSTARNPNGTTASATTLDLLLEPGSGRPRLHARVEAADVNSKDPKAEFIAAARRAAHTAIDQSAEALQQPAADSKPAKPGKARKAGLQKKHALLLGLAALIVAVGATLQLMREPQKPAGGTGQTPQNPSSLLLPMDRTQLAEAPARPAQTTPRQILPLSTEPLPPSLTQAKPDDRVMSQPPRAAQTGTVLQQPEPTIVGSILPDTSRIQGGPSGTPRAVPPVSNDPLMQFDGISGSERLKAAARAGDPAAFIELGSRYLEGRGAPRDLKAAALWFERASDLGAAPAQYRLGAMYREGRGVERNARLAMKYFLTAADAGNARAMHNTAVLLAEGVNGSPDYAGAGEWFKKASEFGIRDSQYNLAILHARGLGVGQDLMASYMWFAAAAASGDEDAAKKRDEVGARLSPEKLQQAKAAAQAWKPKTPDPASNEVAVPPGGWDAGAKQVPAAAQAGAKPKPNRT